MIQLFATEFKGYVAENVGTGRLKAFMEENDETTKLTYVDFSKTFVEQSHVLISNCNLYGFSVYNDNLEHFLPFMDEIKRIEPDSIIVVGSKFATTYYKELLIKFDNIDFVILGDGEHTLLELSKCVNEKRNLNDFVNSNNNIASRESLENKVPAVLDIRKLPWADRTFIKENNYLHAYVCDCHGCVANCSFCAQTNYYPRWNGRTAEDIYLELVNINNECGIYRFVFTGGSFEDPGILGKERIRELCYLLKQNKKNFVFRYFLRADSFEDTNEDRELLSLMVDNGFKVAVVGFESGNDEDLCVYNKRANLQQNQNTLRLLKKMDIYIGSFGFIMFNPYTTRKKLRQNYEFLVEAQTSDFRRYTTNLMLIGKTQIFETVKNDGLLTKESEFFEIEKMTYRFKEKNIDEIWRFIDEYLFTNQIKELSSINEDYSEVIISFYKYVENGEEYKNNMLTLTQSNAVILKEYFYNLFINVNIEKCKSDLPHVIDAYSDNVNKLVTVRNKMLKKLMKVLK